MSNFNWLTPLGFLGLISIVVLILIYILKPNYQKRIVSSTHVWKLSLKYRKKRLPISRLRNIIIIICQILVLVISAGILAQPYLDARGEEVSDEKIIVLDASASMLAVQENGLTRFENAVAEIKTIAEETVIQSDGFITVILAGARADYAIERTDSLEAVIAALNGLIKPNISREPSGCTLGVADIDGAMGIAEDLLGMYPSASVILFTGKKYVATGKVEVRSVSDLEWNAAILSCNAYIEENYYVFEVEVANYNAVRDMNLVIHLQATGCNGENKTVTVQEVAECRNNQPLTVRFDAEAFGDNRIYSFKRTHIYIDSGVADNVFTYDNDIYIYGGERTPVKVQYFSPYPTAYIRGVLNDIRNNREFGALWDIDILETDLETYESGELEPADFYIFEHEMPDYLPVDGVVMLINPDSAPQNSGLVLGDWIGKASPLMDNFPLESAQPHRLLDYVDASALNVSKYRSVTGYAEYQPIINCSGEPVFLVKNQPQAKVAVLSFALQMSNLPLKLGIWPTMMANIFSYYFPPTTKKFIYDINDTVTLNARGAELTVNAPDSTETYKDFPLTIPASNYGTYTLTQQLINNDTVTENFFVKVAASESDFSTVIEEFRVPYFPDTTIDIVTMLLFFCAIALVGLLFIEIILHLKDQF